MQIHAVWGVNMSSQRREYACRAMTLLASWRHAGQGLVTLQWGPATGHLARKTKWMSPSVGR